MKNLKICFVASTGGHLEELSRLRNIANRFESFLVTEKTGFDVDDFCKKRYFIPQISRKEIGFPFKYLYIRKQARKILEAEKPDVLITTGALASYPFSVRAKKMGIKVVFIESFARVNTKSITGRLTYKKADLFLVQWPEMLDLYPGAKFGGGIF